MLGAKSSPYSSGNGGTFGSCSTNRTPALLHSSVRILYVANFCVKGLSCSFPWVFVPHSQGYDDYSPSTDETIAPRYPWQCGTKAAENLKNLLPPKKFAAQSKSPSFSFFTCGTQVYMWLFFLINLLRKWSKVAKTTVLTSLMQYKVVRYENLGIDVGQN